MADFNPADVIADLQDHPDWQDRLTPEARQHPAIAAWLKAREPNQPVIRNPPTFWEGVKSGAAKVVPEILPTAGLLLGGSAGLASPVPGGAAIGAGLGYAGGRQLNRAISRFSGPLETYKQVAESFSPHSLARQALETGQDIGMGALMEMAPGAAWGAVRGVGRGIGNLMGLGAAPTAADLAVKQAAERLGVDLSAAARSGNPSVASIQAAPTRFPTGHGAAEQVAQRTRTTAREAGERFREGLGPETEPEAAGLAVHREVGATVRAQAQEPGDRVDAFIDAIGASRMPKQALGRSQQAGAAQTEELSRAQAGRFYQGARDAIPPDQMPSLPATAEAAARILAEQAELGALRQAVVVRGAGAAQKVAGATEGGAALPPGVREQLGLRPGERPGDLSTFAQNVINELGLDHLESAPFSTVQRLQQRLRAKIRAPGLDDDEKRQLRDLTFALSKDIEAFSDSLGGELGANLGRAEAFYRDEVAQYFAPRAPLRRLMDKRPGAVADQVLSTRDPDMIQDLMKILPERQQGELQVGILDRMRQQATPDPRTGALDPLKFEKVLRRFGDDNLDLLLGPKAQELAGVRRTLAGTPLGPGGPAPALQDVLGTEAKGLVNSLTRGKVGNTEKFDQVWSVLSPDTRSGVRSAVVGQILRGSVAPQIEGEAAGTGLFSTERFMTARNKISPEIWGRLLEGPSKQVMEDLGTVFMRINKMDRLAANPSGTSPGIAGAFQMFALGRSLLQSLLNPTNAVQHLKTALEIAGVPHLMGKAVYSKTGQRIMTPPALRPGLPPGPEAPLTKTGLAVRIGASTAANQENDPLGIREAR